jgi:hypothetical protein
MTFSTKPDVKWQDKILYLAADNKCWQVQYKGGNFPAHTKPDWRTDDQSKIFLVYLIPGSDSWETITTDMTKEVNCTFTPAPEEKTEVSAKPTNVKPTGPGVVEVPNMTPKKEKAKPIFFSGFENARCEIPQSLIPSLQGTANTLKECKDCVLYHNGGVSRKTISDSCNISTDENNPYFSLGPAPKNSKRKTLTGDEACQTALANCRDDNFTKWLVEHGVNQAQLQPADLHSVFDYGAPDFLNRGVVGVIISTKELNGQSGKSGVIEIHVQNPGCDAKYKEPEICPLPPVVLLLTPREMTCTNCSSNNTAAPVQPPALKQHYCFGLKEDLPCYIIDGGILGAGMGWGISQVKTTITGAEVRDGNTVSRGGNVTTSVCGKNGEAACIAGGIGVGALSGWIIHEVHDKYVLNHPDKKGKDKVDISVQGSPTKGGGQGGITVKF